MTITKRAAIFVLAFLAGLADTFPFVAFMNTPDIFNSIIFILTSSVIVGYGWRSHGALGGFLLGLVVFVSVYCILLLSAFSISKGGWYPPKFGHLWHLILILFLGPIFGWLGEFIYKNRRDP